MAGYTLQKQNTIFWGGLSSGNWKKYTKSQKRKGRFLDVLQESPKDGFFIASSRKM
jgi:hypothetical protein